MTIESLVHDPLVTISNISSSFPSNYEVDTSELLGNLEDIFPLPYVLTVLTMFGHLFPYISSRYSRNSEMKASEFDRKILF